MAQQGGYRQPNNPAPVSGPGDNKSVNDQESAANLAGNPVPSMPAPVVSLNAPTQRPNEPVTNGINMGPGAGTEARVLPNQAPTLIDTLKHLAQFDPSGDAELVYRQLLDGQ